MDAFISYTRKTGTPYALRIYEALKNRFGIDVFFDYKSKDDLVGEFDIELKNAIDASDNFIFILTPFSNKNKVYMEELRFAFEKNKRIIVIMEKGVKAPLFAPNHVKKVFGYEAIEVGSIIDLDDAFFAKLLRKLQQNDIYNNLVCFSKLESRKIIEQDHGRSLSSFLTDDVVSVDICAFACKKILCDERDKIEFLTQKDKKVRFIINNPLSAAAYEATTNKICNGDIEYRKTIIPTTYKALENIVATSENVKGRITDDFLPCAIFITRYKDERKNMVKVDFYSIDCSDLERRSAIIMYSDKENYDFYCKQFEILWNRAKDIPVDKSGK